MEHYICRAHHYQPVMWEKLYINGNDITDYKNNVFLPPPPPIDISPFPLTAYFDPNFLYAWNYPPVRGHFSCIKELQPLLKNQDKALNYKISAQSCRIGKL